MLTVCRVAHTVFGMTPKRTTIYLPDELAGRLEGTAINVSETCRVALAQAIDREEAESKLAGEMEDIVVEVGGPDDILIEQEFKGRWLVKPEPDPTFGSRTRLEGFDAGAYWGVALTARRQIAVWVGHCNGLWLPGLVVHPGIAQAEKKGLPGDIAALARSELTGETPRIRLDI